MASMNTFLSIKADMVLFRAFAQAPIAHCCEGALTGECGGDAKNSTVQQDLPEPQLDPVPHKERLERTERGDEGKYAWGEEVWNLRTNVSPLFGAHEIGMYQLYSRAC